LPHFDAATWALIAAASLAAFFVRGLSGFGSSMIGIGALSIALPPAQGVPAFLGLEIVTSVNLLPGVWRQVDFRSLRGVVAGCALATPAGLVLLAKLDPDPMRLVVSAMLLLVAAAMLAGAAERWAPKHPPGAAGSFAVGCASGLLNGAAGIGGPPAVVFYFATRGAAVSRATLIAFFLFTDVYALAWAGGTGLLGAAAWPLIVAALPFSLLGVWLGTRGFRRLDETRLRRLVWTLLVLLGALGVVGALWRFTR
jgi:uncharacterized membrane protein YfcA